MPRRPQAIRNEQVKVFIWAIPAWVAAHFLVESIGSFSDNPLLVVGVLSPLLVALWFLGRPLARDRRMLLGGGFLAFYVCYCLFFAIAAGTEILDGRRAPLKGYDEAVPSNFLGLNRLGDWHYKLAPPALPMHDLVVVTLPSFTRQNPMTPRLVEKKLIDVAVEKKATGIFFDLLQEETTDVDGILCASIDTARARNIPVFFGYVLDSLSNRQLFPPLLEDCVSNRGSVSGYREWDGRVRMVPMYQLGDPDKPALSYKIAELQAAVDESLPEVGLLQFTSPPAKFNKIIDLPLGFAKDGPPMEVGALYRSLDSLIARHGNLESFKDKVVLVGSSREGDTYETPFGRLPGVVIHAYAAHSLHTGHFIRRLGRTWVFPILFVLCYLLVALQARGSGRKTMLLGALALSGAVVATAALAMRFALLWVDVSYPLVAIWLLTGLLMGGAVFQARRTQTGADPTRIRNRDDVDCDHFDVFLSYNRQDEEAVLDLARALKERGLCVWLDRWEIPPGTDWQKALEAVIETVASTAVLIGKDGLGPWEEPEMRACLDQCVGRGMPVIPVLLPGVSARPKLPLFLRRFSWLDLRDGITEAGLNRLEWGITGIKPQKQKTG